MVSFLSICSGIEAASVAWEPLGWRAVGFAEIEPFPSKVLARHWPRVKNHGDFTAIDLAKVPPVDILCGGTPCQAFSIAGKRLSMADARGNLSLSFVALAHELARSHGLKNAVWENVPGCLSTPDNFFGCFLSALVGGDDPLEPPEARWGHVCGFEPGSYNVHKTFGWQSCRWPCEGMVEGPLARAAWRIFDAQHFGLAQRRARVFLVVDFGNGADPAKVLFEPLGLRGNPAPRRAAGEGLAGTLDARVGGGGGLGTDFECAGGLQPVCLAHGQGGAEIAEGLATTLTCNHEAPIVFDGAWRAYRTSGNAGAWDTGDRVDALTTGTDPASHIIAHTLRAEGFDAGEDGTGRGIPLVPVAFSSKDFGADASVDLSPTLRSMGHDGSHANGGGQVAVAFDLRGREGGASFEGPHDTANIRAASGGSSKSYVVAPMGHNGGPDLASDTVFAIQERAVSDNPDAGPGGKGVQADLAYTLEARHHVQAGATRWAVRRLTPKECARLQGFPDGHTAIEVGGKPAADGPQYKSYGNSWAVNVARWIGERIDADLREKQGQGA